MSTHHKFFALLQKDKITDKTPEQIQKIFFNDAVEQEDVFESIEVCFCKFLQTLVKFEDKKTLITLSMKCIEPNIVESKLPLVLLEKCNLDSKDFETFTHFVYDIVLKMKEMDYFSTQKTKLALLAMCKFHLKNTFSSPYTIIHRSKILLLLSKCFSFRERSELNLANEMSNFTLSIEEEMEPTFYTQFWKLQQYCLDPTLLLTDLKGFETSFKQVMNVFSQKDLNCQKDEFFTETLIPSRSMLDIQLDDSNFKAQICLQLAMLFQNFEIPIKEKDKDLKAIQEKLKGYENQVHSYLKNDFFKTLLQRGLIWDSWKKQNCTETFEKPSKSLDFDIIKTDPLLMGDSGLEPLLNDPEDFVTSNLLNLPSCNEVMDKLRQQMDPESEIEEEYSLAANKVYSWKVLRSLSLTKLPLMQNALERSIWELIQEYDGKSIQVRVETLVEEEEEDDDDDEPQEEDIEEYDNKKRERSDQEEDESNKKMKLEDENTPRQEDGQEEKKNE